MSAAELPAAVRAWRIPLCSELSPQAALLLIRDQPWPFALVGRWSGGGAILGCRPLAIASPSDDPVALLDRLPALRGRCAEGVVGGGWFGWLGYGVGREIEELPPQPPRPLPLPQAHLAYYDHLLRRDPDGQWWFEALVAPGGEREMEARLALLSGRLGGTPPPPGTMSLGQFRPLAPGAGGHLAAVERCKAKIRAGEIFQANLSLRLAASWRGDLASLFARLAESLQPAYGAAFVAPWGGVVSMSPELFLRRHRDAVETAPIKGTIGRPAEAEPAESALESLRRSAKDAAEHTMIVDVARNDLGRVCSFGSVEAPPAPSAEAHPGVWHLVSRVHGRLRPGVGNAELVRATFPPCSVTGAPKIQAMRAIAELEAVGREVYTGALGYASPVGGLELSVAIRTFEAREERLWLDAGGAIVADSVAERELEECLAKARPLVAASGAKIAPLPAALEAPAPVRQAPAPTQQAAGLPRRRAGRALATPPAALCAERHRPDPALGVLETILVMAGQPCHLDEHLERLAGSLDALYGSSLQPDLGEQLVAGAAQVGDGALRVIAARTGQAEVTARPLPDRALPVRLSPFTLPGGLGAHKWADRRLLEALAGPAQTPLLLDADGSVLEAAWGNVWVRVGDSLLTPPADGRILPGVTRSAMLRGEGVGQLQAREEQITLADLVDADAVLVSSSLAGTVPATLDHGGESPDG